MYRPEVKDLDSLLNEWLDSGRRGSQGTKDAYRHDVREFLRYTGKPIHDTTTGDVVQYQSWVRNQSSPATECRKLATLRSFFKYLILAKQIKENPTLGVESPKVESVFSDKALEEDEVRAIIEATSASPLDSLLLRLLYVTGGRISEVLGLTWDNLKAKDGGGEASITGKGKRNRKVFISAELWADLVRLCGELPSGVCLFEMTRFEAARMIQKAAKAAKIGRPVTPHQFRHSLATHALERGATLAQVRDQLGHADIKTTSLYLHSKDRAEMIKNLAIK
jgi:integrase/recombinase XerD